MALKFSKMHGLGNDFMVIDLLSQSLSALTDEHSDNENERNRKQENSAANLISPSLIKEWSNRQFGIGFDQLLLVEAPTTPDMHFRYRIFNADGFEVEQCGNGARCFAKYVVDNHLTPSNTILVETTGGKLTLTVKEDGQVTVNMGAPVITPARLPFTAQNPKEEIKPSASYTLVVNKERLNISAISLGNPHAVTIVDDLDNAPVTQLGPLIENHPRFPNRVNAGFMQIHSRKEISLRVFERGVGETLACGTGACAAVVAGSLKGLLDEAVTVHLRGGDLNIKWTNDINSQFSNESTEPVVMTGPATHVFDGEISYDG
ncbi:MAG: diaminopimelate epimerase [Pseudomonadales bacterium]|nr:diaminopimelate epimerase [Pseudomonadales bacterium]